MKGLGRRMLRSILLITLSFICFCNANDFFRIEAFDEQKNNPSHLVLRLRLTNLKDKPLENVSLKYFLPFDTSKQLVIKPYYIDSTQTTISIDTIGKLLSVNINIPTLPPGVYPNSSGIGIGLYYFGWSSLNKEKHFSYPKSSQFEQTDKITAYSDGILLNGIVPNVPSLALPDNSKIYLKPNQKMTFAWRPIPGTHSYRLSIFNAADSSLLLERETNSYIEQVPLKPGTYLWRVEAANNDFRYFDRTVFWNEKKLIVDTIDVNASYIEKIATLNVTPIAARKDTPLLDLGWGEMLDSMEWDKPHNLSQYIGVDGQLKFSDPKHQIFDEEESWRCWAVAATMINHYYGGNITQDEVKMFKFMNHNPDSLFHPFAHGVRGLGGDVLDSVFTNTELIKTSHSVELVQSLMNGNPVQTTCSNEDGSGHLMVIDACVRNLNNGDTICRYLNTDNNGTYEWRKLKDLSESKAIKDKHNVHPKPADSLIWDYKNNTWKDSDGDGILDFDEINRFKSDYQSADTDGDGIDDKTEIWSYTRLEFFPKNNNGVTEEKFADIDKDGFRAERDEDSDGGGLKDGEEDLNHNGIQDEGETHPFDNFDDRYSDYSTSNFDYFTLYAFHHLSINDGVKCYDSADSLGALCNIAAASSSGHYTISIGSKATVGNVYSRGDFMLRSHSSIDSLFLTTPLDDIVRNQQNHNEILENHVQAPFYRKAKTTIQDSVWKLKWPITGILSNYTLQKKDIVIKSGDTLQLKNGDHYSFIKIESGGTLIINPGETWVNEIQLHDNSRLLYSNPYKASILHVCGNFTWRAKIQNQDYLTIAQHFKLIQHSKQNMFVDNIFAGTIFAPTSNVILGQSNKIFYGTVIANDITVHQYSRIYHIPFSNEKSTIYITAGLK